MSEIELINHPLYKDPDILLYHRFEGNSTATVGGNGTDYNMTYGAALGRFGQGASFNAASSRIDLANSTAFDVQAFTISAWVWSLNFDQNGFIFEKGSVNSQYSLFFETNNINFRTIMTGWNGTDWAVISTVCLNAYNGIRNGMWNHIVASFGAATKKIYVNSVLQYSATWNYTIATNNYGMRIGAYGGAAPSYWYNGYMDEVALWKRVLAADEVASLYDIRTLPFLKSRKRSRYDFSPYSLG